MTVNSFQIRVMPEMPLYFCPARYTITLVARILSFLVLTSGLVKQSRLNCINSEN